MARPDAATKAAIEERKALWAKQREEAAAAQEAIRIKVQAIADDAVVAEPGGPSSPDEIRAMLRRAFRLATLTKQPGHAVSAAMALAKFDSLYVECSQSAVAIGSPGEFTMQDTHESIQAKLVARFGERYAKRIVSTVDKLCADFRDGRLDGEPRAIEHDGGED
jgi:hypothetical protein